MVRPPLVRLTVVSAFVVASGCSTTLSTLQTGRTLEPGRVQAVAGSGVYAPVGQVVSLIAAGKDVAERARLAATAGQVYSLTQEELETLAVSAVGLAVMPPSAQTEVSVRAGLVPDFELGLRYSVNALRLDAKYRLVHRLTAGTPARGREAARDTGSFDVAVGAGVSRYFFKGPVFDALGFVHLDDFSRWDVEVPIYVSTETDILKLYAAPKYVFSHTSFDERLQTLAADAAQRTGLPLVLPATVLMHFVGATLGAGVGYRWVHVLLELTGGYTFCTPELYGKARALGGVTLYPSVGLAVSF